MGMNCAEDPFNLGVLGVIQNGSVFRNQTHTSGHLFIGVAPGLPVCHIQLPVVLIALNTPPYGMNATGSL